MRSVLAGVLAHPPAVAGRGRGFEQVERPVDRADRSLPFHRAHRARGQDVAQQDELAHRVEPFAVGQPRPAAHHRVARALLLLRAADLEVVLDEGGALAVHRVLGFLGRTGPVADRCGIVHRIRLAFGAEQPEGGERALPLAPDLAAHLRDVATLPDDLAAQLGIGSRRGDEGNLGAAQRRQVGECPGDRGIGDQRGGAAVERAALHPVVEPGKARVAACCGDRIEKVGNAHAQGHCPYPAMRPD